MTDIYRTIRSLRSHERGIKPDPAWVRSTRDRLLMQVRNTIPSAEAAEKNRKTLAAAYPGLARVLRGPAFAILSIVALIGGGSIASVRAAERSLPGDALYAIKLVTEQTRLALTPSAPDRVKLKAEFTKRRAQDLNTVITSPVEEKEKRVRQATEILKQDLRTLKEQLDQVKRDQPSSRGTAEAAKVVDREAVDLVRSLKETKAGLPENVGTDVKKTVTDAQAQAADLAMNALGMLVDASRDDATKDVVTSADLSASLVEHREVAAAAAADTLQLAATPQMIALPTPTTTSNENSLPPSTPPPSTTGTVALARDAQNALGEVESLLNAAKVDEAMTVLRDASAKSFQAQSQLESIIIASGITGLGSSTSSVDVPPTSGTTTTSGANGGTSTSSR